MKKFYSGTFLYVYEGDSLVAAEVVPVKSCAMVILTPLGKKNLKDHYKDLLTKHYASSKEAYLEAAYTEFTASWASLVDKLLSPEGNICIGCLPAEKDVIASALVALGYSLAEEFILDMTKIPKMAEIAKNYKHTTDLYLLFNKTAVKTGIDMEKVESPKDLLRKIIKKCTNKDDVILHLFSNTAKVAAIAPKLFVRAICISDDAFWCQVAVDRATDEEKDRYWSRGLM